MRERTGHGPSKPVVYQRHGWITLLRPSIAQTLRSWCRNIKLLSIAYDFRPRLRSRLTLGRLALPSNPWAFGGQVSRLSYEAHKPTPMRGISRSPTPSSPGIYRQVAWGWAGEGA
jgi:hypothetical protein